MINLIKSLVSAVYLYMLRRRQVDSVKLRSYFRRLYGIDVGLYSYGCFDRWRMPGPLQIGRYCSIANTVRSTNNNHLTHALTTHPALYDRWFGVVDEDHRWDGSLVIEDDVWIGHYVVILPGCRRIGRGAVIGAGSIVTRDVAPYTIVAGNPARKLRDRFSTELMAAIDSTRWWELDLAQLRELWRRHPELIFSPNVEAINALSEGAVSHDPLTYPRAS